MKKESENGFCKTERDVIVDEKNACLVAHDSDSQSFSTVHATLNCLSGFFALAFSVLLAHFERFGSRFRDRLLEMRVVMVDAACQVPEEPQLELRKVMEKNGEVLEIILDQTVRANMRMQDLRNRTKDMQVDLRHIKRHLKMEDMEEHKRAKFAIDPTEGKSKDYKDDVHDKKTLQLGSPWSSNLDTRKEGLLSDVQPRALWQSSPTTPKTIRPEHARMQGTEGASVYGLPVENIEGMVSKQEGITSQEDPVVPSEGIAPQDPVDDDHTTPDEAASDPPSLEPENKPDLMAQTWIVFEGDLFPVRMDQLTIEQEQKLENGHRHHFVGLEDSFQMKQIDEQESEAILTKEKKEMPENDKKVFMAEEGAIFAKEKKGMAENDKKVFTAENDKKEEKDEKVFILQIEMPEDQTPAVEPLPKQIKKVVVGKKEKIETRGSGNIFDEKGRIIQTLD